MKNVYKMSLCVYSGVMIYFLFLRRLGSLGHGVNLIPFETIRLFWDMAHNAASIYMTRLAVKNLLGNVFMFVPFGLIPLVFEKVKGFLRYLMLCFGVIFSIEVLQLITGLGSFDVDDIILNIIGTVLGYCILVPLDKLISRYFEGRTKNTQNTTDILQ